MASSPWFAANPQFSTNNSQAATLDEQPADAAVALGGGQRDSQDDVLGFAVGDGGSHVFTATDLVWSGKARTLMLGGSWPMPGKREVPLMRLIQDWLTSWGLAGCRVANLAFASTRTSIGFLS